MLGRHGLPNKAKQNLILPLPFGERVGVRGIRKFTQVI